MNVLQYHMLTDATPSIPAVFNRLLNRCFSYWHRALLGLFLFCSALLLPHSPVSGKALFPAYQAIQPNIVFWENIYGKYSSRKGILHDRDNLAIIYNVVDLVNWDAPGSGRINRKLIKLARQRVKKVLTDLGHGKKPQTPEEKRIAALFPKQRHTTFLKARERIRLQIGQKDRFRDGVVRSGQYSAKINAIFRSYGLPTDLAYLPHVESSFNPKAHSKAGASGLWQFTRGTGKKYLTINHYLDERRDPILSTHAAAKLLKENYQQLQSWPLAITAYNYGRSGMMRAQAEHKDYVNIFRYYRKGYFKFASRNFYSEFLAAKKIAKSLENDPTLIRDKPDAVKRIRMKGYVSSAKVRSFFRISRKDLARLNPALGKPVLDGTKLIPKDYLLYLPATKQVRLNINRFKDSFYYSRQQPDTYHIVRKGDTVGKIAGRYKTTIKELSRLNDLNKHATIRVGQKLALPDTDGHILILKDRSKTKAIR